MRAARLGRVLVLDEADKAPLEVGLHYSHHMPIIPSTTRPLPVSSLKGWLVGIPCLEIYPYPSTLILYHTFLP